METSLRPLTLGEILDRTAQLYRTNFVLFAGIFSIYAGVALVLNLMLIGLGLAVKSLQGAQHRNLVTFGGSVVELLILFLLAGASVAAVSRAVAWLHLGERATIRGAYSSVLPRLRRYIWLMTITAFVVWTPIALLYCGYFGALVYYGRGISAHAATPAQHMAAVGPQTVYILGATVAFGLLILPIAAYTIFMALRYALALPACVVEDLDARASLRRAVELSKGSRGRIFVLGLLVGIIKIGLVGLTQIFIVIAAFKQHGHLGPGQTALSQVIEFFTTSFLGPIYAAGITLFYYDQRIRKEGFDIEWMMQAAGLTVPPPAAALPPAAEAIAEPTPEPSGDTE